MYLQIYEMLIKKVIKALNKVQGSLEIYVVFQADNVRTPFI